MPNSLTLRVGLHRCRLWLALGALALAAFFPSAFAQTGTLAGTVVDADFGDPLPGVNVVIEELGTTGSATDLDGRYRITAVPSGTYTVVFSFVGFQTQRVTGVGVVAGEMTTIDLQMGEDTELLGEIVVEAEAVLNNEAGALRVRQRSVAVSDAITAELISRSGSSDAADAMERVTGAAVEGGKYVTIRGLGDRYANTQLNGAQLPTADPDRRSVQFDLFPSGLIENIVTLKTFTADKPGNFSGGLVDIKTRSFPDQFTARLSASAGVAGGAQFSDSFLGYSGPGLNTFATGADKLALPSMLDDPDVLAQLSRLSVTNGGTVRFTPLATMDDPTPTPVNATLEQVQVLNDVSRSFNRTMQPTTGRAPVNQSYSFSLGNQNPLGGGTLGYIVGGNYGRSASFRDNLEIGRYEVGIAATDTSDVVLDSEYSLAGASGSEEVTWGGIANLTYRLSPTQEIGINSLYTRSGESEAGFATGQFLQISADPEIEFADRGITYTERELLSLQLRGRHQLFGQAELEWLGTYSQNAVDEPDQRFFFNQRRRLEFDRDEDGSPDSVSYRYGLNVADIDARSRFFRNTEEDLTGGSADLSVPVELFGSPVRFKVGGRYDVSDRGAAERSFNITTSSPLGTDVTLSGSADFLYGDTDAFLNQYLGVIDTTGSGRPLFGATITENTNSFILGNSYDASLDIGGAYAMAEIMPFDPLRVILGLRYETTRQSIQTEINPESGLETSGRIENNDFLPSINLVYALSDEMNLRTAATRTLARPTFQEFSPGCRRSFSISELRCGNPTLNRSLLNNLDLRWEWFNNPGAVVAVSGYYKFIEDAIELAFLPTSTGVQTYRNVPEARIYGIELEARQQLSGIVPALEQTPIVRNLAIGGNLSLIQSYVDVDSLEFASRLAIDPTAEDTRDFQGQSPYIVNLDFSYDNAESQTNLGLFFNVFGSRLATVSAGAAPDVYERPRPQLDLVASQGFLDQWSLKFSAKNLLASDYLEEYDAVRPDGGSAVFERYSPGRSFSIGISYSPRFGGGAPPPTAGAGSSGALGN